MELIKISSLNEIEEVSQASLADGHYAFAPTHYWRNEAGAVAGYFSAGIIPVGHFWMKRDSKPRESFRMVKACENVSREIYGKGIRYGLIACQESSPFHATLKPHFGYQPVVSNTTLFGVKLG